MFFYFLLFGDYSYLNQRGSAALGVRDGKSGEKLVQDIFLAREFFSLLEPRKI